ncbi:MAG: HesA/MoeB/ThiF family protein [Oscillospiraceae bacterium]
MSFERQISMPEIGADGQRRLRDAAVTVVGAGGLGCPALTYLACAGVGKITVIDGDTVSQSNLNRQFLFGVCDLGKEKAKAACEKLCAMYPDTDFLGVGERLTSDNIKALIKTPNIIADCTDNLETRLLLNKYALDEGLVIVEGGVCGFGGFVTSIDRSSACLECLGFLHDAKNTDDGILGTTAGVIGSLMANECIKIILSLEGALFNKILSYDGQTSEFEITETYIAENCTQNHDRAAARLK